MSRRRRRRLDPKTEELRNLGRRLRREGRMTAADWLREVAPLYAAWEAAPRDTRGR